MTSKEDYRNIYKAKNIGNNMIGKNVAIALLIIALVLVSFSAVDYFSEDDKISSVKPDFVGNDTGNGKVGVVILPPAIEDRNNGS